MFRRGDRHEMPSSDDARVELWSARVARDLGAEDYGTSEAALPVANEQLTPDQERRLAVAAYAVHAAMRNPASVEGLLQS